MKNFITLLCEILLFSRQLNKLIYNNFVDPNAFRFWIKGIIDKVFNKLQKVEDRYRLLINNSYIVKIKKSESGPAITLIVNIPHKTEDICVDLAPSLPFDINIIPRYITKFDELGRVCVFITVFYLYKGTCIINIFCL